MSKRLSLCLLSAVFLISNATAQIKLTQDTIQAPYIGFTFGTVFASDNLSTDNGIHDLYKNPFLNFGLESGYKFKTNWLVGIDGQLTFGTDVRDKEKRFPAAFSHDHTPFVIGSNGTNAEASVYNRALSLRVGGGKLVVLDNNNPNSGLALRLYCGYMQQKTIFMMYKETAPQLEGDYARLYDHKRRGFMLTESIGYWFMSNHNNFINLHLSFEVTQYWNTSARDYVIDEVMGLHGPDNTRYFDLLYTIKVCWLFPLKGKTAYDYYFF